MMFNAATFVAGNDIYNASFMDSHRRGESVAHLQSYLYTLTMTGPPQQKWRKR